MANTEGCEIKGEPQVRSGAWVGTPRTDAVDKLAKKLDGEDYYPGKMREHAKQLESELNQCQHDLLIARTMLDDAAHGRIQLVPNDALCQPATAVRHSTGVTD